MFKTPTNTVIIEQVPVSERYNMVESNQMPPSFEDTESLHRVVGIDVQAAEMPEEQPQQHFQQHQTHQPETPYQEAPNIFIPIDIHNEGSGFPAQYRLTESDFQDNPPMGHYKRTPRASSNQGTPYEDTKGPCTPVMVVVQQPSQKKKWHHMSRGVAALIAFLILAVIGLIVGIVLVVTL